MRRDKPRAEDMGEGLLDGGGFNNATSDGRRTTGEVGAAW